MLGMVTFADALLVQVRLSFFAVLFNSLTPHFVNHLSIFDPLPFSFSYKGCVHLGFLFTAKVLIISYLAFFESMSLYEYTDALPY